MTPFPFLDARGLAIAAPDRGALDRYESALQSLHSGRDDARGQLASLLAAAPDFVAAHCLQMAAFILGGDRPAGQALRDLFAAIDRCAPRATDRERRHLAAARAWLGGDVVRAAAGYGALVTDHPRDSLALHVAQTLDFRLGRRESMRDRVAYVLPQWNDTLPGYAAVLGMHAFALEENGDYTGAEDAARRALALEPTNAAALHAVAHVLEMRGQARDGIAWMQSTHDAWASNPAYATHMAWHLALFHVEFDQRDEALALYARWIAPRAGTSVAGLVDAAALLWRLALRGGVEPALVQAVAKAWRRRTLAGERAFNLVHAVISLAGAGDLGAARRAAALLTDDRATRRVNTAEDLALAAPFAQGVLAFAEGDYAGATTLIRAVRAAAQQCGGSIAQCDLIHLTLTEAALRSAQAPIARALAVERAARRPQSSLNRWLLARAAAMAPVVP